MPWMQRTHPRALDAHIASHGDGRASHDDSGRIERLRELGGRSILCVGRRRMGRSLPFPADELVLGCPLPRRSGLGVGWARCSDSRLSCAPCSESRPGCARSSAFHLGAETGQRGPRAAQTRRAARRRHTDGAEGGGVGEGGRGASGPHVDVEVLRMRHLPRHISEGDVERLDDARDGARERRPAEHALHRDGHGGACNACEGTAWQLLTAEGHADEEAAR